MSAARLVLLLIGAAALSAHETLAQCDPDTFTIGRDGAAPLVAVNASGFWACGQTTEVCSALASAQARVTGACNSTAAIRAVNADGTVTCSALPTTSLVLGVTAGPGLTGGGAAGDVTLSADTDFLQRRLAGNCTAAGAGAQAVAAVGPDGTVTCVAVPQGDVTDVVAGVGLAGGGSAGDVTLSADTSYLQQRLSSCAAGTQSITAVAADGTVTCATGGDITSVTAGSGLTGGGVTGDVTLNVDTNSAGAVVLGKEGTEQLLFRGMLSGTGPSTCVCHGQWCSGTTCAFAVGSGILSCAANFHCFTFTGDSAWPDNELTGANGYYIQWSSNRGPTVASTPSTITPYIEVISGRQLVFHVGAQESELSLEIWKLT